MTNRQIEIPVNNNENVFSRSLSSSSPTNSHISLSEAEKELQELKKKLTELKIRFDTSPNYYLRDDYQALINIITSSLIHLYKDSSHAQIITSWEEVVSNETIPSAKLVKDTIDLIESSWVWQPGSGDHSVLTLGTNCQAIGDRSVAEGEGSVAMGIGSHVEGHATKTFETGIFAHAEGQNTNAYGQASHAEGGGSVAHNDYAHAEGGGTTALGISSHTEGDSTIASNPYEHAEGHYNESHSENPNLWGLAGNTVHSIGIGNGLQNHKNAVEVMQNGDIYIIGLGGYDGKNIKDPNVKTILQVISELI